MIQAMLSMKNRWFECGAVIRIGSLAWISMIQVTRIYKNAPSPLLFIFTLFLSSKDTKRSRLLTVTIDGKLNIWDFDATKHIIYKDQTMPNGPSILSNTTSFDSAFNLIGNVSVPGMCMALTSKHIMVSSTRTCHISQEALNDTRFC